MPRIIKLTFLSNQYLIENLDSNNESFFVSFACDQWYYHPRLLESEKINIFDCQEMSKRKIKIVGKNPKFYIGFLPVGVYVFAPASVVENRIVTDPQVYQFCKNVIFTNTEYDNFENANLFLKSNYFPELFKDQCFELNTSLHNISLVFLSDEKNGLFAFRSNILYLNFNKPFDNKKLNRILLKVIGTRNFKFEERNTFYPYYQAIQIE